ncbi:unnamed protein product [Caenorhabditis brenneri]
MSFLFPLPPPGTVAAPAQPLENAEKYNYYVQIHCSEGRDILTTPNALRKSEKLFSLLPLVDLDLYPNYIHHLHVDVPCHQMFMIINWCEFHQMEGCVEGPDTWDNAFFMQVSAPQKFRLLCLANEYGVRELARCLFRILVRENKTKTIEEQREWLQY